MGMGMVITQVSQHPMIALWPSEIQRKVVEVALIPMEIYGQMLLTDGFTMHPNGLTQMVMDLEITPQARPETLAPIKQVHPERTNTDAQMQMRMFGVMPTTFTQTTQHNGRIAMVMDLVIMNLVFNLMYVSML
jgi:hypothetical protein